MQSPHTLFPLLINNNELMFLLKQGDGKQTEKEGNVTGNVYVKPQKTTGEIFIYLFIECFTSQPVPLYRWVVRRPEEPVHTVGHDSVL